MLLVLILTYLTKVEAMAQAFTPNSFGSGGQRSFPSQSPIANDPKDKALTLNSIDPSKSHNSAFLKDVMVNKKAFDDFMNLEPEAKDLINKILGSYGIKAPGPMGDGLPLPNADIILKNVEEALAIHASFKEFLRKLLESVQQYLARSSMLLAELVLRLKKKYSQILNVINNYQSTNSEVLRDQFQRELINHRSESEELIKEFIKVTKWRGEMISGVITSL